MLVSEINIILSKEPVSVVKENDMLTAASFFVRKVPVETTVPVVESAVHTKLTQIDMHRRVIIFVQVVEEMEAGDDDEKVLVCFVVY